MSGKTKIQWADKVWNPTRGCSEVSEGCRHCYAMAQAHRFSRPGLPYDGLTRMTEHGPIWNGKIMLVPEALDEPLRWKKPQRVFVNSMSDLFHEDVPWEFIEQVFAVMALSPQHTYQILTKRPERMAYWLEGDARDAVSVTMTYPQFLPKNGKSYPRYITQWPLPNVHPGVSVENQATADERIPLLLQTPAAVRFLSIEPLLEPVNLVPWLWVPDPIGSPADLIPRKGNFNPTINWIVVGGESGRSARPCNIDWIRSIVAQCKAASVPAFVKQLGSNPWGSWSSDGDLVRHFPGWKLRDSHGGDINEFPEDLRIREFPA